MGRTHSQGHHNKPAKPAAKPARPRETDYTNTTGHGVGAKAARVLGPGKTKTRPFLEGDALNADYRRPPCLDEVASYRWWLCDRKKCRANNCDAWCSTELERRLERLAADLAQ